MIGARVVWPPYPYEAGFCITDDPDASTFAQTRAVYDYLRSRAFVTTKAVWAFTPTERCGVPATPDSTLRGVTLQDQQFLLYCKDLYQSGFEVCPHGASAGNNRRERTRDAFELLAQHFGNFDTFICHSKNADNIYWEDKITSLFPFCTLLHVYSRHRCDGEEKESPYYWGDLCSSRINQIRLYRTRCRNTLKRNPSMPYYDPRKPLVNGWFSATKRSLADCASEEALERLKDDFGLTVLYQYLHRYANPESCRLDERFVESVDRIHADPALFVGTVSTIMKRLRQLQAVFTLSHGKTLWLINAADEDIDNLRIEADRPFDIAQRDASTMNLGRTLVIKTLPKNSLRCFRTSQRLVFSHKNSFSVGEERRLCCELPFGQLLVNLDTNEWHIMGSDSLPPGTFRLKTLRSGTGIPILSSLRYREELGLLADQTELISRELLLGRRSLRLEKYLDSSRRIPMEDHDNW